MKNFSLQELTDRLNNINFAKSKRSNVIYPKTSKTSDFAKLDNIKNSIFLAGPCPRKDYRRTDWREGSYNILDKLGFDGYILNPTNEFYNVDNSDELEKQTRWEWEAMCKASAIVFNLMRTDENPGFTSNVEIGLWLNSPSIYVCIPEDVKTKNANRYIEIKCKEKGIPVFRTLEDCYAEVVKDLNRGSQNWYTSDTHFSQERTLTLSRRPFDSVWDMDMQLISNWNKRIRKNDVVYHLGDFGENGKYLDCLNFGTLKFIKGNYERDGKSPDVLKDMKNRKDVEIFNNDKCKVENGTFKYTLRHEPISNNTIEKDEIVLFGHIHGRQMIKKNGIDVGVDVHRYCPCSQEEINFFANCLDKGYYDEQVFAIKCK